MPFAYYDKLSRKNQKIYEKSDAIVALDLPDVRALRALVADLDKALASEDRKEVQKAASGLTRALLAQLKAPALQVKILARRPSSASAELHGLYSWEEGEIAEVRLWMRTAAHRRVVRFRTFLRTLLHELCHHLDFTLYELADSFHTEGFFRRESSLMRQLAPKAEPKKAAPKKEEVVVAAARRNQQLELF